MICCDFLRRRRKTRSKRRRDIRRFGSVEGRLATHHASEAAVGPVCNRVPILSNERNGNVDGDLLFFGFLVATHFLTETRDTAADVKGNLSLHRPSARTHHGEDQERDHDVRIEHRRAEDRIPEVGV